MSLRLVPHAAPERSVNNASCGGAGIVVQSGASTVFFIVSLLEVGGSGETWHPLSCL